MEEGHQMSQTTGNVVQAPAQKKARRTRSASPPKPAFVIIQLLGEDNQPMSFDKRRVKVLSVERSAEKVMEQMEDGVHPNAFYLRVVVPPGVRPNQPRVNKQPEQSAA
jgi:hypothetical protein